MSTRVASLHEQRVDFLDDLAVLAGFSLRYAFSLPDGRRPDVLRVDVGHKRLFIGDGKNTETPGCTATGARLQAYFVWLKSHLSVTGRTALFALCFGNRDHHGGWIDTLEMLADEVSLPVRRIGSTNFGERFELVWLSLGEVVPSSNGRGSRAAGNGHAASIHT